MFVLLALAVKAAHLKAQHISGALGENHLKKVESHQNQPVLSTRLCSADP